MKRWSLLVLILVIGFLMGCTAGEVKLGVAESDSTQKLTPGQVIAITLDSNPSTGYGWQVVGELPAILQQVGDPEYKAGADSAGKVGAGGMQTLRFKVLKAGTATLTLGYMRSWEKDVAPAQTYTLKIEAAK
jgi:inhibitor of cysteine peptidase